MTPVQAEKTLYMKPLAAEAVVQEAWIREALYKKP